MSDLIDRQAAINEIERAKVRIYHSIERAIGRSIIEILDDVEKDIRGLASAEPERLKGEWKIKKSTIHPYGNDVCCSICGHTMGSTFGYRFCPMCGADMRGEQDG